MPLKVTIAQAKRLQAQSQKAVQMTIDGEEEDVTPKRPRDNPEERTQVALFDRRDFMMITQFTRYFPLAHLFSTLNGIFIPPALLARIKRAGLSKGVLDLYLIYRVREENGESWPGIAIDLKSETGRPTPEQLATAEHLKEDGWRVYFCGGVKGALTPLQDVWFCLCSYLGLPHTAPELTEAEQYRLANWRAEQRNK